MSVRLPDCKTSCNCTDYIGRGCDIDQGFQVKMTLRDLSNTRTSCSFNVPAGPNPTLRDEDFVYMDAKGVFTVPPEPVCNALFRCYFLNVHHYLPIINVRKFFLSYIDEGPISINLMLLWAIFLAASDVSFYLWLIFLSEFVSNPTHSMRTTQQFCKLASRIEQ